MSAALTLYGFPAGLQVKSLFCFFGAGFLAGVVYDILRLLRIAAAAGRRTFYFFDGAFVLLFGVIIFCTSMAVSSGELHFFMLLAAAAGFIVYYLALDKLVRRVTDRVVRALRAAGRFIFRVFSFPVRIFVLFFVVICKFFSFPVKKIIIFIKKVLQKAITIMYNIRRVYPGFGKFGKSRRRAETAPNEKQ
ncbi:MAG: spore cortex biosynthesis protein YabQ [Clostridia bacterium]|nr:spore cortex biosynthesis protein YabQ [Clostridia bacterium]